jgi:hypothetical protein
MGLGLRAAARELGISHPALLKAERAGRVKKLSDGSFDVEACRTAIEANSSPRHSRIARIQQNRPVPTVIEATPEEITANRTLAEAARQLEWEKLRAQKQKTDREAGLLCEVSAVNAYVAGMIIKARDDLSRIGQEISDRLANETDAVKCRVIVDDRIFQVLESLKEYRPV